MPDVTRVARGLRALQDALVARPPSVALARAESGLLRLAVRLARHDDASAAATYATPSRRRAAVRRIEAHLDAFPEETPTIPELCALAGVGERTLEYAFREQLGTTPVRFLRLRRLNRVRRQLMSGSAGASVTEVALRAGFLDLGRFARDYRQLFGELPSATLRGARSILTA